MLIKKTWSTYKRFNLTYRYTGYFLFGFLPLYIKREVV